MLFYSNIFETSVRSNNYQKITNTTVEEKLIVKYSYNSGEEAARAGTSPLFSPPALSKFTEITFVLFVLFVLCPCMT